MLTSLVFCCATDILNYLLGFLVILLTAVA